MDCIKHLKIELTNSCSQLSTAQQQLGDRQRQLDQLAQDLETSRRQREQRSSSFGQKLANDLQMEKEKCNKKISDLQNR